MQPSLQLIIPRMAFSPDGKNIASVSRDGYIHVFETPVMYDRKSAYVSHRLTEWAAKSTCEKWDDYRKRIEDQKTAKEEVFNKECDEVISKYFKENVNWQKIMIKDYDAKREVFYANSNLFGNLVISVPHQEAEFFKNNFGSAHVKKANIVMGKVAPELSSATIESFNNKEYNVVPLGMQ